MNKQDKAHLTALAELGCIACHIDGNGYTPCEIHHPRNGQGMSQRAPHKEAFGLCYHHHRAVDASVPSIHGKPNEFIARYGTEAELLALALNMLESKRRRESLFNGKELVF